MKTNLDKNWLGTRGELLNLIINLENSDDISERNLSKVVVFYNDNTFDELQKKIL